MLDPSFTFKVEEEEDMSVQKSLLTNDHLSNRQPISVASLPHFVGRTLRDASQGPEPA